MNKALKIVRVVVQLAVLAAVTWSLMAAPSALVASLRDGLERWQLVPMAMLGGLSAVAFWLVVTLVFGRVYCSTVCPLGTLQDVAARLSGRRRRYRYKEPLPWFVRTAMLAILVLAVCFGSLAVSWSVMPFLQVSPYDSYSSMVTSLALPVADWIAGTQSVPVEARLIIAAAVNLVFVVSLAAVRGRELCNSLCPVGAALGCVNTMAIFHIDIDTDRCTHCRRCEDVCKASCIDSEAGTVDPLRCVVCFDCVAACRDDALHYTTRRHRLSIPMLQSLKRQPRPAMSRNLGSPALSRSSDKHALNSETLKQ